VKLQRTPCRMGRWKKNPPTAEEYRPAKRF
jgi:hypothetical protein